MATIRPSGSLLFSESDLAISMLSPSAIPMESSRKSFVTYSESQLVLGSGNAGRRQ
jgi:hypothetical protein